MNKDLKYDKNRCIDIDCRYFNNSTQDCNYYSDNRIKKCEHQISNEKNKEEKKTMDEHTCIETECDQYRGDGKSESICKLIDVRINRLDDCPKLRENSQREIITTCDAIKKTLLAKNIKYGDSALNPELIFVKENNTSSIRIRLDDKMARIKNSDSLRKNDVFDAIGYLNLLCVEEGWDNFDDLLD